jgi:hypothetical protein
MRAVLPRRGCLALFAALALACDDTDVTVAINHPPPPPPQSGGGGVIIISSSERLASRALRAAPRVRERSFRPSPDGNARIAADDHAVAADPGTGGKNYDADTNLDFGHDGAARHAFLRARLRNLPRKARILEATLAIQARHADTAPGCEMYVGLVPRDGRWDGSRVRRWAQAPSFDGIVTARDAEGAPLAATGLTASGAANFGIADTGDRFALVSSTEVGQTLTVTQGGALHDVQVQLRRAGTPSGDTRLRVERCRADDGSDDRPDGVALAVSDPVAAGAISTQLAGGLVTYAFASSPTLAPGGRYAFVLESDAAGNAANHLQWKIQHGDRYRRGGLVNRGLAVGWNVVRYPEIHQLPFFFEEDLVTPRAAPHGTLLRVEVPPFPEADAWVDVADVTALLQEWIDDPAYAANDVVAIQLFTTAATPEGARRRGKDFRLRVTWREPEPRPRR